MLWPRVWVVAVEVASIFRANARWPGLIGESLEKPQVKMRRYLPLMRESCISGISRGRFRALAAKNDVEDRVFVCGEGNGPLPLLAFGLFRRVVLPHILIGC